MNIQATLGDGIVVAVKKLLMTHSKAKEDFESEVRIVSNVHHHNLVRLLGWSKNEMGPDLLLVYEFMENKSLDIWLYGMFICCWVSKVAYTVVSVFSLHQVKSEES